MPDPRVAPSGKTTTRCACPICAYRDAARQIEAALDALIESNTETGMNEAHLREQMQRIARDTPDTAGGSLWAREVAKAALKVVDA